MINERSIQVGIMTINERSLDIKPVRGKKRFIKVHENAKLADIKAAAIQMHALYDQDFCAAEDYILLYPDKKQVTNTLRNDANQLSSNMKCTQSFSFSVSIEEDKVENIGNATQKGFSFPKKNYFDCFQDHKWILPS